jgi:tripartite-type tricarboxylate transporter receptor subunit TctC
MLKLTVALPIVCAFSFLTSVPAAAQGSDYPSRPIHLVVPVAAGGGTDMVGRVLAEHLSSKLGQPVTVENRPGAGSLIGVDSVAKAAPDGYTLVLALSDGFTILPSMKKEVPYDPVKSFTLIGLAARTPFSYSVSNEVPANTLRELVDYAKKNAGKLKWAISGSYSTSDLATELLKVTQGLEYTSVPYRGGALALADVVSARVDGLTVSPLLAAPQAAAGKLKILAQTGPARVPMIADVPTAVEAGFKDLVVVAWFGLAGPANLPPAIAAQLGDALSTFHGEPSVNQRFAAAGIETAAMPAAEFAAYITSELAKWRDVVSKAGIPLQ